MDKVERCSCPHSLALEAGIREAIAGMSKQFGPSTRDILEAALDSVEGIADYTSRGNPQPEPPVLGEPVPFFASKPPHSCDGSCITHKAGILPPGIDS